MVLNQKMIISFGKQLRKPPPWPMPGRNDSEIILQDGFITRQNKTPLGRCRPNPPHWPMPRSLGKPFNDRNTDLRKYT
jgi:hypothetical protein